jgi:dephospho-CoA kinase
VAGNVKIVVLTGALGSGKSTVAEIFANLGAHIIDADVLARRVVAPGTPGLSAVINEFGPQFLQPDKTLDRKALGKVVFADPSARKRLEDILHPLIRKLHAEEIQNIKDKATGPEIALCVIPLFFESRNHYSEVDNVIVVSAPREASIDRVMKRDSCSRDLAEKKYDSQLSLSIKEKRSDYIIKNDSDLNSLRKQAEEVFSKLG